jgi:hypothetical protein
MLSFPKLLVLVAVVAIIWFGFRWFERWERERRQGPGSTAQLGRNRSSAQPPERDRERAAEEMTACPICGTYVAAGARSCGRTNCPFPRS